MLNSGLPITLIIFSTLVEWPMMFKIFNPQADHFASGAVRKKIIPLVVQSASGSFR
jgi:hypothetical protein